MTTKFVFASITAGFLVSSSYSQESYMINKSQSDTKKPNIILLMADDLGYGDVSFNGNEIIITPNLEKMSQEGIMFDHFYAAAPLCSPTRASVLTGRSPFRQGIFAAHTGGMRVAEITVAEVLKKQKYETGFFGKWHLGWVEPDEVESRGFYSPPWHHGFQEVFATKSAVPTWNPTRTPDGWKGFGAEKDGSWGGSVYIHNGQAVTENLEGDDSRVIMDRAIPFIEKSIAEGNPFLATIWFHAPHEPIVAGPDYLAKYPGLPEEQKHLYGCITAMDEQIGRLRDFLKEKGISENTVIFFCSDNGPADPQAERGIASAGPFRGHKHQMWEGGIRVPALVVWPGSLKEGKLCSYPASTVDLMPTILEIVGLPEIKDRPMDGVSMLPALKGEIAERALPLAFGYQRLNKKTELYAFIDGQYKICIPDVGDKMMLFDLWNDPAESNNLALSNPELLKKMEAELEKIKKSWFLSLEGKDYLW